MAQSTARCQLELGNNRYVKVCDWNGELRVDIREWNEGKPTKKGISLPLSRWKNLVNIFDQIDEAKKGGIQFGQHLGGNVYCHLKSGYVDVRKYWKPAGESVPTKKGIFLRPDEYSELKVVAAEVGTVLPELDGVVPCIQQDDHMNQLGYLRCTECNPNDFQNW
jgi:hypothetical protein